MSSKSLIFLAMAGVSTTFCSRSFHPIRCDFVAAFPTKNSARRSEDPYREGREWGPTVSSLRVEM
jgi:hypothetical protein